jgi:hypothetical protein
MGVDVVPDCNIGAAGSAIVHEPMAAHVQLVAQSMAASRA